MAALCVVAVAVAVAAPTASATTVELRVEAAGAPAPIFAGPVSTSPHPVDGGDGSGAHTCAGPVGGAPSATATGALDDAMRAAGIPWRGNWDPSFRDFFVERIGAYASRAPDDYWSLSVDGHYASGGCQAALAEGDEVRFFYGPLFGEPPASEGGTGGGGGASPAPGPGSAPGAPAASPTPATSPHPGRLAARAARYLRRHREAAGEPWSRLALAVRGDARDAEPMALAAAALLGTASGPAAAAQLGALDDRGIGGPIAPSILRSLRADGSLREETNATALASIALGRIAPRRAARAADWLLRTQSPGGGFGFRRGVPPDIDTTGLAAWALAREGRRAAARRAALFVASAQSADGGFPSLPGGESNSQSTGLALVALRVGGVGAARASAAGASALDYLAGIARRDGSIPYAAGADPTPVWSTAQALLGLLPRGRLLAGRGPGPTVP